MLMKEYYRNIDDILDEQILKIFSTEFSDYI